MPLYIRDDEVAQLARELQVLLKAETLTDAVRRALVETRDRHRASMGVRERLGKVLEAADALGPATEAAP